MEYSRSLIEKCLAFSPDARRVVVRPFNSFSVGDHLAEITDSFIKLNSSHKFNYADIEQISPLDEVAKEIGRAEAELNSEGNKTLTAAEWLGLSVTDGPVLIQLNTYTEPDGYLFLGYVQVVAQINAAPELILVCDEKTRTTAKASELAYVKHAAAKDKKRIPGHLIESVYRINLAAQYVFSESATAPVTPVESAKQPVGFVTQKLGVGECEWTSPCFLLSDRDLTGSESVRVWAVDKVNGRVLKTVTLAAYLQSRSQFEWPKALVKAVRDDRSLIDGSTLLQAGYVDNFPGYFDKGESFSTQAFNDGQNPYRLTRLWVFSSRARLFTNAPFIGNAVIANDLSSIDLANTERVCVEVRDKNSKHLHESLIVSFSPSSSAQARAEALCMAVGRHSKMLWAGAMAEDGVTIAPNSQHNALWVPYQSELSVTVETVQWVSYGDLKITRALAAEELLHIHVHDDVTGAPLAGSPLLFTACAADLRQDRWPVALAQALGKSPLGDHLRLDMDATATDCPSVAHWKRAGIALRIWMSQPLQDGDAWVPMVANTENPAVACNLSECFESKKVIVSSRETDFHRLDNFNCDDWNLSVGDTESFGKKDYGSIMDAESRELYGRYEIELQDKNTAHACYRWIVVVPPLKIDASTQEEWSLEELDKAKKEAKEVQASNLKSALLAAMEADGVRWFAIGSAQSCEKADGGETGHEAIWLPSSMGMRAVFKGLDTAEVANNRPAIGQAAVRARVLITSTACIANALYGMKPFTPAAFQKCLAEALALKKPGQDVALDLAEVVAEQNLAVRAEILGNANKALLEQLLTFLMGENVSVNRTPAANKHDEYSCHSQLRSERKVGIEPVMARVDEILSSEPLVACVSEKDFKINRYRMTESRDASFGGIERVRVFWPVIEFSPQAKQQVTDSWKAVPLWLDHTAWDSNSLSLSELKSQLPDAPEKHSAREIDIPLSTKEVLRLRVDVTRGEEEGAEFKSVRLRDCIVEMNLVGTHYLNGAYTTPEGPWCYPFVTDLHKFS
ncbi:hypothetical protein HU751_006765 [Pseudomonas sp. BW13M1]|uniref:Uncharacterized protein n=1 Tax=Pseudomonas peradeniyensis TaxID=2745488 RepID=A0A923K0R1_9PSED|nr:hypothetical protein [Pseudomonas peradeniyensis]MBV4504546.1 hypothetical protein [Pseudomonas peradeniyensis]